MYNPFGNCHIYLVMSGIDDVRYAFCMINLTKCLLTLVDNFTSKYMYLPLATFLGKGKGTRYLTSEVPLLSREYSPRKPTVRSFYPPPPPPPLSIMLRVKGI